MSNNYKIRIGDTLYENSKPYNQVFAWKVLDIWLEDYILGKVAKVFYKAIMEQIDAPTEKGGVQG